MDDIKEKTEETEVIEPEALTESQQEVKQFTTVEERVKANQIKINEANKVEEELKAEEKVDSEPEKVKKPANEVIRELKKERNEARTEATELKGELGKLNERLESIEEMLKSGDITQKQAGVAAEKVSDALDDLEIPEDLQPYKDVLFKIAETIADKKVAPLLESQRNADQATRITESKTYWNDMVEKYPEMFDDKVGEDGLRELKPAFDKEAMEMIGFVDISKPEGIDLIFSKLYAKVGLTAIEKAKIDKQIEAVKQSRATKVESGTPQPSVTRPKNIEDIVKRNMKNAGMEVR